MSRCRPCNRHFPSSHGYQQHLQKSVRHLFDCLRCNRHFRTRSARDQHVRVSEKHNVCYDCNPGLDFSAIDRLVQHRVEAHNFCDPCYILFDTPSALRDHKVSHHNMCRQCGRLFKSVSNLANHHKTHAAKDTECFGCSFGCDRMFISIPAMLLHLEGGKCPSLSNPNTVKDAALDSYFGDQITQADSGEAYCPYCSRVFRFMSGLLQHVESRHYEEYKDRDGPLQYFLELSATM